ncbi:ribose/proton symporter RbsU [Fructilactobacillus fructivorans]|uniref:Putative ribose uptake protein RbsU, GRP transporter family n=1 Tax=Fructilactobacillus fructivorans TaxID=1614 RepID=A0A0C1M7H6_9LACO|nr:GRP family sugar transporter [Fructilactobacillus fructivorans]KID42399.1 putative ribose uptake protein RbsU, GRP transporter family [Fructilactobacillus fructivorans]MCT0150986.1 ribose transporter RbsU [Fructilactobacillus fructivorans]MCT2867457.1 ribose transporter RbsU [Fructilactobacillus fructivorans]MCT2869025.1 ribose transporter RbsU [Fructilactobacillus fructivorans]MCT2873256.1 ribose transporter RbsU [Fructilactobacillus fructivorans]
MNWLAILIGLGPMIGWGLFPTISSKIGGKPANQILGATLGTLIFAVVLFFIEGLALPGWISTTFGVISGLGWGFGQIMQFKGFKLVGSSRVMPITTALQLILTSLWGVFVLGDWTGIIGKVLGFAALIIVILGATLTAWVQNPESTNKGALKKATIFQIIGAFGYLIYSAAPQVVIMPSMKALLPGMQPMDGNHAFLPQAVGMVLCAVIYGLWNLKDENVFVQSVSYKNILAGLSQGFGMLMYLISAQPDMNGLATANVLGQLAVLVSTLTGIYFLHQRKTPKEMTLTYLGLVLIVFASAVTAFI